LYNRIPLGTDETIEGMIDIEMTDTVKEMMIIVKVTDIEMMTVEGMTIVGNEEVVTDTEKIDVQEITIPTVVELLNIQEYILTNLLMVNFWNFYWFFCEDHF
jgi:hypothetical protein